MPEGELRPHWATYAAGLKALGPHRLKQRWAQVQRILRENGVTFNVHGDPGGLDRPWTLDPAPVIVSAAEWESLERGISQRLRLYRSLLEDMYGQQICLAQGWLPPEVAYGHPGFLPAAQGLPVPLQSRPFVMSLDLGRAPDGEMMVLSHRNRPPHGCGYALENRLVIARLMPEVFQRCGVRPLTPFFEAMREGLNDFSFNRDEPRVALWTPGQSSETYFEQAYLSQFLGIPLVESADLTVRDNRLYLKLLEGLQPVHVLFRWLRDQACDPLELPSADVWGVPGLLQVVRSQNLVLANGLGCEWADSPALAPFLPGLCRFLLGEELLLPDATSWWCGDPNARSYVLDNLEQLVVRRVWGQREPIFVNELTAEQKDQLRRRLDYRPAEFVAQETVKLSTCPSWDEASLEPRPMVLRVFAVNLRDGVRVMPGGLARVAPSGERLVVSAPQGGRGKDTWVLSDSNSDEEPPRPVLIGRTSGPTTLHRGGDDLPSRAADNFYWLGRYVERVEDLSRVLRCCLRRRLEAQDAELLKLLQGKPEELQRSGDNLRRLAGLLRDRLSNDSWRILNRLSELCQQLEKTEEKSELAERVTVVCSAFGGTVQETMTRSHAWRFLDLGRRLERAGSLARRLEKCLGKYYPFEERTLEALLEIADSTRTYRRRYPIGVRVAPVVDMMLGDENHPRSITYQLLQVQQHLQALPVRHQLPYQGERRILLRLSTDLRLLEIEKLLKESKRGDRKALRELLSHTAQELVSLGEAITRSYLTHLGHSRQ